MENAYEKSVIVFAAHPDDTEIFVAGTLKLLKDKGYRITICTMTGGGLGGLGMGERATMRARRKEAEEAAALLEADYHCLGGRDGYLFDTQALRIKTAAMIRKVRAGIVISHLPMDYHADHRATSSIVDAAAMLATLPNVPCREAPLERTPLFYHSSPLGRMDPLGRPIANPLFYVNIGSSEDLKMRMLDCHKSQIELMRLMHGMDDFHGEMQKQDLAWGKEAGCTYAEAYWQHLGGGFPKVPLMQRELGEFMIQR